MKVVFGTKNRRDTQTAQTLVFFLLAWGTIMLLCGLAIDSGLLYLAKARMGRAVDGASLAAVGNFNRSSDPVSNRDDVATIMRNFAVANYTDLSSVSSSIPTPGGTPISTVSSNGQTQTSYQYNFNDGTQDANGQYRRFIQVTLNTGSSGNITSATCNARCPVTTYFIGYGYYFLGNGQSKQYAKLGGYSGPSNLVDLKVSSSAVATRNPRLIEVVIDRSASMLQNGGGASGLPPAVMQFLDFFDTSSDNIGIVSFGSNARVEMPITTNFLIAGTNNLTDAYNTQTSSPSVDATPFGVPGLDPEISPTTSTGSSNPSYDSSFATSGVRRLKFGGTTAASDGIRLGLEQMMGNAGFNDPDVIKYMVIFTDGRWNTARTLFAAPGYTNEVSAPTLLSGLVVFTNANYYAEDFTNTGFTHAMTNGQYVGGPDSTNSGLWSTNLANDANLVPVPTLSPLPYVTNSISVTTTNVDFSVLKPYHTNDFWQSADGTTNETLANPGTQIIGGSAGTQFIAGTTLVNKTNGISYYSHDLDVWLQPGSVCYYYTNAAAVIANSYTAYVSDYTLPNKHIRLYLNLGGKVDLVVPGYVVDGLFYDGNIDMGVPDNPAFGESGYPKYRADNFQQAFEWGDDANSTLPGGDTSVDYSSASLERQLAFRNYANLLTGFYISKPDQPNGTGYEPLITEQNPPGAPRPLFGLGPYYPGAPYYWMFGGETNSLGYVTNAMGLSFDPTYALLNPSVSDPDTGQEYTYAGSRHNAYSINMLSPMAAPEWSGELFYMSSSGGGTSVNSGNGTTSASQLMQSSDWQSGLPNFAQIYLSGGGASVMTNEPTHNTNITGSPSVWRPLTFNGSNNLVTSVTPSGSDTGGYVSDGNGHIYKNAMAWSGRPTHYYDFSKASWEPITDNHTTYAQAFPLDNWEAQELCWHARALDVTIYTVGYGNNVSASEQAFLAVLANATNTTAGGGTAINYNPSQPIGQQFYATTAAQISNDFYSVGQAINEALTGGS